MRLLSALKFDILALFRYRIVHAYLFVTIAYIVFLNFVPESIFLPAKTLIIFSDPVVLGFYFIGGFVLMEKSQNTFDSLFVTSLRIREYIITKVCAFTILTILASLMIVFITTGLQLNIGYILIGVTLSSIFFTLIGFILAVRSKSLNDYLMTSSIYTMIFFLPVLDYLDIFHTWIFYIVPSYSTLILIEGGHTDLTIWTALYAIIMLGIWIGIAYMLAKHSFYKSIVLKIGS